jgi:hypothetical protein
VGFVLFNVNKETDWSFSIEDSSGKELKQQLKSDYFREKLFLSNNNNE